MCKKICSWFLLLAFSSALWGQDFSTLYQDLDELDNLIASQRQINEEQKKLLLDLSEQLANSGKSSEILNQKISGLRSISGTQAEYLIRLREQLNQAEQIRQAQLNYQKGLGRELWIWRIGTITFAASTLGLLVWGLTR